MIFTEDNSAAILPEAKAFVMLEGNTPTGATPGATPTMPKLATEENNANFYIPWGDGNRFPLDVLDTVRQDPIISQIIRWKASAAAGRGVRPVKVVDIDNDGQEIYQEIKDKEVQKFFSDRRFYRWLIEAYQDYYTFQNQGSELIISKDRSKITHIVHQETKYARYNARNKNGIVDKVTLNANWPQVSEEDDYSTKLDVVDVYGLDPVAQVRNGKAFKYWYPGSYPAAGDDVYQTPTWWALEKSHWMDVRRAIPKFKKYALKNRMMLLYHVEVPATYWGMVHKDWEKISAAERKTRQKAKLTELNNFLTNPENAGKAFMSEYGVNMTSGQGYGNWIIKHIADGEKEGKYLDDFQESTAEVFYAFGVDPTLVGFSSKDIGARSGGSDKREAWLLYMESIIPDRQLMLEQPMFAAEYNGWVDQHEGFKLIHIDKFLTTLDTGGGTQKIVS